MSNRSIIALAAQGAGTLNSNDFTNIDPKSGVKVVVDITAVGGTPTATVKIQGKDPISGKYIDLLTSAAYSGVSTNVLTVGPTLVAAANVSANDIVPKTWRVSVTVAGTTPSVTGTIGVLTP